MGCPIGDDGGDELIVAYGARTLAPQQQVELERHLESCARCREVVEAQLTVWSALDAWTLTAVSSNFDQMLFRRIENEERKAWWRRLLPGTWSWRPAVPVGVACAALVAAFLLKNPTLLPEMQPQPQPKIEIEQVEHALDDMDMLKQLGLESSADKAQTAGKI
jgi:hypothetical protein